MAKVDRAELMSRYQTAMQQIQAAIDRAQTGQTPAGQPATGAQPATGGKPAPTR